LKEGKQLYLQRRITSEASIGKILFGNGWKLAANLGLAGGASPESGGNGERNSVGDRRIGLLRDFKELARRLERIRLIALSEELDRRPRTRRAEARSVEHDATA
jgi:glycerol-3-phosphate O-acyltransferase